MIDRLSGGPEGTYDLLYENKVMTVIIISSFLRPKKPVEIRFFGSTSTDES